MPRTTSKTEDGQADQAKVTGKMSPELQQLAAEEKRLRGEGPPEADQQAEPEGEPELTASDVIKPREYYRTGDIEFAVGIEPHVVRSAVTNGRVRGTRDGSYPRIQGWALLEWIEKDRVPYSVPKPAQAMYRREQQRLQELAEAKVEGPKTTVDQAVELAERQRRDEKEDEQRYAQAEWGKYIALLFRANQPAETDSANLAGLMRNLEITPEQVKRDLEIVERAQELAGQHDDREAGHAAYVAANQEYKAVLARHKSEEKQARKTRSKAEGRSWVGREAASRLAQLAKERPQLFDLSVDPPRLRRLELK